MNDQRTRTHVDRRTIVRAGVWTVPAVTIAAAAPAFAAASTQGTATLLLNSLNLYGADYTGAGKPTTAESQTSVQNVWQNGAANGGPTLTSVTLRVTYQNKVEGNAVVQPGSTGWTFVSVSGGTYTFLWTGTLAPGGSTPTVTWRVPLKNASSGSLSVSAFATSGGSMSPTLNASTNL
jgi:hypothetical protein